MSRFICFFFLFTGWPLLFRGQTDTMHIQKAILVLSGYVDLFYQLDARGGRSGASYLYNYNRRQELNLNLGRLQLKAIHPHYRASLAVQTGTYVIDNYKNEPSMLGLINEAQIGLRLVKGKELWLNAGIMSSPIGFESAIGIQNWTLTRSLVAENSPYYLAGVKVDWEPNEQWAMGLMLCNGWQRIQRLPGSSLPAIVSQVRYKGPSNWEVNWNAFAGTDDPDSTRRMRYYNNLYFKKEFGKGWGLLAGFDIGWQQKSKSGSAFQSWWSPVLLLHYPVSEKWSGAFRAEYFDDGGGIIVPETGRGPFKVNGISLNMDYAPFPNIRCRMEGRWLHSRMPVLNGNDNNGRNALFLTASLQILLE